MKRRKKPITLRSIKQLRKRTGRRPVEVPLITKKLVDEVMAQPRQVNPIHLHRLSPSSQSPSTSMSRRRLIRLTAASVALLIAVGVICLTPGADDQEKGRMTARTESIMGQEDEKTQIEIIEQPALKVEGESLRSHNHQHATVEKRHEWQTAQKPTSVQEEHGNGGIVCYGEGELSDSCDEEMVTRMLLAFL